MTQQQAVTVGAPDRRRGRLARRIIFWVLVVLALALLLASAGIVVLAFRGYVDGSPTMENTIGPTDHLFVITGSGIRRGDIVVLHVPATATGPDHTFVKRVIGLPGDHVACCDARGRVTVNGKTLDETYLYPGDPPSRLEFSATVGKGKIFVMGDRRNVSVDSRTWGPVSESGIVGRVVLLQHGSSFIALRTPGTFVSDGLAPPDSRPDVYVRLVLVAAGSVIALLILAVTGIISTIIRGRRSRRPVPLRAPPAQPAPPAPPAPAPQKG